MEKKTVAYLLTQASECERKAAEVYAEISKLFSRLPQISSFWKDLSADEKMHLEFVQGIISSSTEEQRTAEVEKSIWEPVENLLMFLKSNLPLRIENLNEAYNLAQKIENFEVTTIIHLFAQKEFPDSKRDLFLSRQLDEHMKKLFVLDKEYDEGARESIAPGRS